MLRKRGDEHAELPSADQWTAEESADSQKLGEEEEETTLLRRIDVLVADRIERDLSHRAVPMMRRLPIERAGPENDATFADWDWDRVSTGRVVLLSEIWRFPGQDSQEDSWRRQGSPPNARESELKKRHPESERIKARSRGRLRSQEIDKQDGTYE